MSDNNAYIDPMLNLCIFYHTQIVPGELTGDMCLAIKANCKDTKSQIRCKFLCFLKVNSDD